MTLAVRMEGHPLRYPHTESWARRWFPFVIVTVVFAAVVLYEIELPGVYSDEVAPDYNVVRVLNWNHPPITPDALPGNAVFGRLPILNGLHYGTQTVWLGLPAFWVFGTSVAGLRITHGLFALGILAAVYALLYASGMRRWWAALACVALAVDPAFVYSFRTQGYLSLAPSAWMFLSLYALQRAATATVERQPRWLALSGLMMGLAFSGYFIYMFFAPVIALAVVVWVGPGVVAQRIKRLAYWIAGFVIGTLPYIVGYGLLIMSEGGLAKGWAYIVDAQALAGGRATDFSFNDRLAFFQLMIRLVFSNASHHVLIFGEDVPAVGAELKTLLLIGLPPLLWVIAEYRKRATPMLRILLGMQICFVPWALYFGGRLWAHHYEPLIPIAYATLALALLTIVGDPAAKWRRWIYATPFAVLLVLNAAGIDDEAAALRAKGGVGLYSDAINHFADDVRSNQRNDRVVMPDWGLFTSAVFLTGGKVEMDVYEQFPHSRAVLCSGRDVSVALITGDRAARFATWQRELDWGPPSIKDYRQRDGTIVFSVGTFSAREAGQRCPASATTQPVAR
jgi:hypothetical protein